MSDSLGRAYLGSVVKRMLSCKQLGENTFGQLEEEDFFFTPLMARDTPPTDATHQSNSIAVIIRHMSGNMISRWTDFLTGDGEKEGRDREKEFRVEEGESRTSLLGSWEKGWTCLLDTLGSLKEDDLLRTIYIRHEPLMAVDAINRQLAHYPYHIGQIVYIGKMIKGKDWLSLSIPRGASDQFNRQMEQRFDQEKK